MERKVGTVSRGIRCPIIREGDNLADIVVASVLEAAESEGFELRDRDVISVTESIVARAQGNYAPVAAIAEDVKEKLGGETVGVIFPILSRNRFAICLRGIAMGAKKVVLMLSYPSDEVGNELVSLDQLDEAGVNPYSDILTLEKYRELFGENKHPFTGVDYVDYYSEIIRESGADVEVIFANNPREILKYTKNVLTCDIHSRARTKRILKESGAQTVCGLDDILNAPVNGSGCNEKYGLLGSNKSTEDTIKLFPRDCTDLVLDIQAKVLQKTGRLLKLFTRKDFADIRVGKADKHSPDRENDGKEKKNGGGELRRRTCSLFQEIIIPFCSLSERNRTFCSVPLPICAQMAFYAVTDVNLARLSIFILRLSSTNSFT